MAHGATHRTGDGAVRLARRLRSGLEVGLNRLGGAVLAALLAVVLVAVALRYLAGTGLTGSTELAVWLYLLLVFIGLPTLPGSPLAMRLDLVSARLPPGGRRVATALADGLALFATLAMATGASRAAALIGGTSPALGLPEGLRFAPVAVAGALGAVLLILTAVAERRGPWSLLVTLAVGAGLFILSHQPPLALASPGLAATAVAMAALMLGAPLPHALIAGLALAVPLGARLPEAAIVQNAVAGIGRFLLLAIPFFLLTGILMNSGRLAERLVALARSLVGHRPSGMAQTTLLTNLMFAGVSGSSVADAAFGAKVLAPALTRAGYRPERAAAIVAATAILPNIVPPSIAFLILAIATNLSVGQLFTGGLAAGLVLAATLALALRFGAAPSPRGAPAQAAERKAALVRALPALGLAAVIFFGIRLGIATPTEAAALAALYALVALLASGAAAPGRALGDAFVQAGREASAIGLLIGTAAPFVFLLAVERLPQRIETLMAGLGGDPLAVMAVSCLVLLAAGCVLDIAAGILLLVPLLLPAAAAAGIDPIHFGVVAVVALMIGGLTPPVGMLVYVAASVCGLPSAGVFRAVTPLTLALTGALAVLAGAAALDALL